ncbi:hypothetical protein [Piscirickettsia litoralis]|uniref:Uncharacterized protein n=1 Tax=Piscirickettsia litoralis TaxID=1891921 RepID=A0ABX3A8C0_9GAMM|nr:hypothetical protein [Piscirickettsia litoralis]ODN42374.1 hypothetical protein BGC07_04785 [Piscirickettsia litoralis]
MKYNNKKQRRKENKIKLQNPETILEVGLSKAVHRSDAYLKLWDLLAQGDLLSFEKLIQNEIFKGECMLFYADSKSLKKLCLPENIDTFKNILKLQKKTLIAGKDNNKEAVVSLIQGLIKAGNIEGLLALDKLGLNADEILFKYTKKGLMHHLVDYSHQYNNEKFYTGLFAGLHDQGFRCRHTNEAFKIDYHGCSLRANSLQYAIYSGFFELAHCFMKEKKLKIIFQEHIIKKEAMI